MLCTCCSCRSLELDNINRCAVLAAAAACCCCAHAAAHRHRMHRRHVHRCAVRTHCMSSLASTRELCPVHHPPRAAAALCTCRWAALMPRRRAHAAAPPPRPPPPCRAARTRAHPLALSRGRTPTMADQCGARCVCAGGAACLRTLIGARAPAVRAARPRALPCPYRPRLSRTAHTARVASARPLAQKRQWRWW